MVLMTTKLSNRILDTLNVTIVCLDASHAIRYLNTSGEALFESSASKLIGRRFESLFSQVKASTIQHKLKLYPVKTDALTERGADITLANGRSIIADYSIYPFAEGSRDTAILVEIRPLEYQLQIAQEELNQLQKQLSRQLGRSLAHEIRNPLSGIRGAAQLLEKGLGDSKWTEYTEVIISEVDRLQSLVNNITGPGDSLQPGAVNILEVLEHIRKIILAAEPDRIKVHRDYDPSIPEIQADRNLLIQAFLNIARNAVQAIEKTGEIIFKTRIDRRVTIGKLTHSLVVQVDITDSGRGVSEELSDTIFLPMITDKADGSGLGLPIAQEIISRHGGAIRLKSSAQGTTFSTILPLQYIGDKAPRDYPTLWREMQVNPEKS